MKVRDIEKMSDAGVAQNINEICDGLKAFVARDAENAKELLVVLISELLEPLDADDFFGTEGWEHGLGIE